MTDTSKKLSSLFDKLPQSLADQAFSPASWEEHHSRSYGRLAFLGDSVLNIAVSNVLFPRFEHSTAGRLTKLRAQMISRRSCAEVAPTLGVPERIKAAAPEGFEREAERLASSASVRAEAVEAGIGACFLEFGFDETAAAVAEAFHDQIEFAIENLSDPKSELQERLARRRQLVAYRVVKEEGLPHDRRFETVAEVDGRTIGTGTGRSKKESEQEAARLALEYLGQDEADEQEES